MEKSTSNIHFENHLIGESSPYLQQHAHQPVDWYPWSKDTLELAKKEGKMLLVSVGYSTCHWCHVMAEEVFEDLEVADWMNQHFICVKIDREERPDIDQVYMEALHLLKQRGGWPLNCFALPDGRPFYGGTYFSKENWLAILEHLVKIWRDERSMVYQQAEELERGIESTSRIPLQAYKAVTSFDVIESAAEKFKKQMDMKNGGFGGAPKFPMPVNLSFLMRYAYISEQEDFHDFTQLSLNRVAQGGLFDQLAGGFARYSVDAEWKVPHFEKMLYDNAQLISLYSQAYQLYQKDDFHEVVERSLSFIQEEMTHPDGGYYAAIDADSEGEEGKFYVWKTEELTAFDETDQKLIKDYFGFDGHSLWENGKHVLAVKESDRAFASRNMLSDEAWRQKKDDLIHRMLDIRNQRHRPHTDTKLICSWNALMLSALVDASMALGKAEYKEMALEHAYFLMQHISEDHQVSHILNADNRGIGFLEDYAFLIQGLIKSFQLSAQKEFIDAAQALTDTVIRKFYDEKQGLFTLQAEEDAELIGTRVEYMDNVMPSANSVMANALLELGTLLYRQDYLNYPQEMLNKVGEFTFNYPEGFANWMQLACNLSGVFYTIVVIGPQAEEQANLLRSVYMPQSMVVACEVDSDLPPFKGRFKEGETLFYRCLHQHCFSAVTSVDELMTKVKVY